jgi:thiamine-monophosphate kinase
MQLIVDSKENTFITGLVGSFERSPLQLNGLHESDAELLRLPGQDVIIAITTDSICEEIERGMYTDPYMIGYMVVTINISDLAAVGARAVGLLLSETLTHDLSADFLTRLQMGIDDASRKYTIGILGGDTNFSSRLQIGATAIGYIQTGKPVTRKGCSPGDHVFCTGRLGMGNAYALEMLIPNAGKTLSYMPVAKIVEGILLSGYASACIDSSDGFMAALDQLMRVNGFGFTITTPVHGYVAPEAMSLCERSEIPGWFMLAGPHGEFELIFAVPPGNVGALLLEAQATGWTPIYLGTVTEEQTAVLNVNNAMRRFDTGLIRNLFFNGDYDIRYYLSELMNIEHTQVGGEL